MCFRLHPQFWLMFVPTVRSSSLCIFSSVTSLYSTMSLTWDPIQYLHFFFFWKRTSQTLDFSKADFTKSIQPLLLHRFKDTFLGLCSITAHFPHYQNSLWLSCLFSWYRTHSTFGSLGFFTYRSLNCAWLERDQGNNGAVFFCGQSKVK